MGDDVDPNRISGDGVRIDAGCRIRGAETAIAPGVRLGAEGPVTVENCQLGPGAALRGGYAREATFLEGSSMGPSGQVREACLLEEQANGAHCVGLKQTILFPFVTLGSLINFCDCLMAGGTSRKEHSEVGSSYIHFNFTPDGEKTTPSLIGDVPRGVMLNQSPIFLGGQGGMVGPLRVEYGNVVAAGTILRRDVLEQGKLVVGSPPKGGVLNFVPRVYAGAGKVVEKNILYLANLVALEHWYEHARRPFFNRQVFGDLIYAGARNRLRTAKAERIKRMRAMALNMNEGREGSEATAPAARGKREFLDRFDEIVGPFEDGTLSGTWERERDGFLLSLESGDAFGSPYVKAVQALSQEGVESGTRWLQGIVDDLCRCTITLVPGLKIFKSLDY